MGIHSTLKETSHEHTITVGPYQQNSMEPFKDRDELESRLATLLATREPTGNGGKEALTVAQWSPLVDITEDEKEYLIKAELPDMKKEDVRLTVENDVLDFRRAEIREGRKGQEISPHRTRLWELRSKLLFRRMRMGAT